ncbi:MAG: RnfABCDGE type electron transport complex subunit B [Eubacterium sp.]|jgi:electron transport complex protein RnfB
MATAVIIVVVIGLVCSVMLSFASKVFEVPVDETAQALRAELPGANCGGCGFAGCDDYAKKMADDRETPCNLCVVGGASCAAKLAKILGVDAGATEKKVAVVMCDGSCDVAKPLLDYVGPKTCKAAKNLFGGNKLCSFGCLGFGDCEAACKYESIKVINGVAHVDRNSCVACGMCAKACPQQLIRISPAANEVIVHCSNKTTGAETRKVCSVGCIGCKMCEKQCKFDAVHVENNLAFIDPEKCKNCGMCAKACPTGAILNHRLIANEKRKRAAAA